MVTFSNRRKHYAGKFLSVTSEDTFPTCVVLSNDGYKMYVSGQTNDMIFQYNLSTPFNIETAIYGSVSLDVYNGGAGPCQNPLKFCFSVNGTKLYVISQTTASVYQYSMTSAFDISTATYDTKSFDLSTQDSSPTSISISPDGQTMIVLGRTNCTFFQYALSTPWDISTASYATKCFLVSSQETIPYSAFISPDGSIVFLGGQNSDSIFQYDLSTEWDISTASYNSKFVNISALSYPMAYSIYASSSEKKIFVCASNDDTLWMLTLQTAWDITTAKYDL